MIPVGTALPNPVPSPSLFERAKDTVNPLQHIPFVNMVYRSVTSDTITPDAALAGGFLFGGPIGALGAAAGMIVHGLVSEIRGGEDGAKSSFAAQPSFTEKTSRAHFGGAWDFNS